MYGAAVAAELGIAIQEAAEAQVLFCMMEYYKVLQQEELGE